MRALIHKHIENIGKCWAASQPQHKERIHLTHRHLKQVTNEFYDLNLVRFFLERADSSDGSAWRQLARKLHENIEETGRCLELAASICRAKNDNEIEQAVENNPV